MRVVKPSNRARRSSETAGGSLTRDNIVPDLNRTSRLGAKPAGYHHPGLLGFEIAARSQWRDIEAVGHTLA